MTVSDEATVPPTRPVRGILAGAKGPGEELVVPRPMRRRSTPRWVEVAQRSGSVLAVFGLWWLATTHGWISTHDLSSPPQVWDGLKNLIDTNQLWPSIGISLRRALLGLGIGAFVGIGLGLVTGLTGLGDRIIDPIVQMFRTVPVIALAPLFILWLGINETPKVVFIAVATVFPLYVNTHGGVRQVDPKLHETAWIFGLSRPRLVWQIVIPAALPTILAGLRLSLGISLLALVFAEQINATSGIGYLLSQAQNYFNTNVVVLCIILYAFWGLLGDLLVRLLTYVLVPWQRAGVRR